MSFIDKVQNKIQQKKNHPGIVFTFTDGSSVREERLKVLKDMETYYGIKITGIQTVIFENGKATKSTIEEVQDKCVLK